MSNAIENLKQRIASLEQQKRDEDAARLEKVKPYKDRIFVLEGVIAECDRILLKASGNTEAKARKDRAAAWEERKSLTQRLSEIDRPPVPGQSTGDRVASLKQSLHRMEYEAVTSDEIAARGRRIIAAITDCNIALANLLPEQYAIEQRRQEATEVDQRVRTAQAELCEARAALEAAQADAFIAGTAADVAPLNARVTKAEKAVSAASEKATAARAALPRITEKLNALEAEQSELESKLRGYEAEWFANQERAEEKAFTDLIEQIETSALRLVALSRKTQSTFGLELLKGVRQLRRPVLGRYAEAVNASPTEEQRISDLLTGVQLAFDAQVSPELSEAI